MSSFVNADGSNPYFPEIKRNFGFGCMRLPMKLKVKVDYKRSEEHTSELQSRI